MNKRAIKSAYNAYPLDDNNRYVYLRNSLRVGYQQGYEQAEKDIVSLIQSRLNEIIGDAQPKPILRAELQELIKQIEES